MLGWNHRSPESSPSTCLGAGDVAAQQAVVPLTPERASCLFPATEFSFIVCLWLALTLIEGMMSGMAVIISAGLQDQGVRASPMLSSSTVGSSDEN